MREVSYFLNSLDISKEDTLIVGVSYGPDSMFLLNIIKKTYKQNKIVCAHIHHNHRKESDLEALELEKYCKNNDIIFEFMKIDKYTNDKFTEEEARIKRYSFFETLLDKYNSMYLFTAHHGDDLIETVLMKIVRGSTLKGYSGINLISKREKYSIIRPLLYLTKEDILKCCNENNIPYAVDKSNMDNSYTRNRFRNNILPLLKEENINVHKKFINFSNELLEYEEFVNNVVLKKYDKIINQDVINLKLLIKEDGLVIKKIIEQYLFNIYKKDVKNLDKNHISLIINMIKNKKSNDKLSLPNNINLIKTYNKIYFDKENSYNSYCFIFEDYLRLPNGFIMEKINNLENTTNFIVAFDSSEIKLPLYARSKVDGDKIEVLGLNGSKKIKDIFIDEKISLDKRNLYPVLSDSDGKVLWLPGLKKSKYDKSKKGKYDIILKYYKEDNNYAE